VAGPKQVSGAQPRWGPPWIISPHHRVQIDYLWLFIATFMLISGTVFFGWRGLLSVSVTALAALLTCVVIAAICRYFDLKPRTDPSLHILNMGLLLGLVLPVVRQSLISLVAGVLLGVVALVVGRSRRLRGHPVVVAYLMLWFLCGVFVEGGGDRSLSGLLHVPRAVLKPSRMVVGDVCDVAGGVQGRQPWHGGYEQSGGDAWPRAQPYVSLLREQRNLLRHDPALANALSNGRLPSMGAVVIGAVPGTVGASSRVLLIVLGLFLMYKRLSWWPMVGAALIAALATLLVMPLTYHGGWTIVLRRLIDLGPAVALTYIAYTILASPFGVILLILAPQTAPTSSRGRLIYGIVIGCGMILFQWFLGTPLAGMWSLLIAGVLSRPLDSLHKSPFIKARCC